MYGSGRIFRNAKKVGNREMRRCSTKSMQEGAKLYALFLAVLAQKGGEVVITQGTLDQVGANFAQLGYSVVPGKNANEFIVRLTEGKEDEQPVAGVEEVRDSVGSGPDVDLLGQ